MREEAASFFFKEAFIMASLYKEAFLILFYLKKEEQYGGYTEFIKML
jgi:hypothetical protein